MGYTSGKTQLMVGLGMSAISDSWGGFAQNVKPWPSTSAGDEENSGLPRPHAPRRRPVVRKHILNLMCQFTTSFEDPQTGSRSLKRALPSSAKWSPTGWWFETDGPCT